MTVDTLSDVKRLEATGDPRGPAELAPAPEQSANCVARRGCPQLVTGADFGQNQLENRFENWFERRIEAIMWERTAAIILAIVLAWGPLFLFAR